ncbi:restriction endonuclease subunit S [Vibrio sp. 3-2(1)]|uniref:restriction endonuclease subunit S n=1 Tax=Vibrio sp. 3-2(1) TaxID=2591016 RepID=UPI0014833825|nr:restriction endonuclease subunit S [Vibrio sp. 3-2(1)]
MVKLGSLCKIVRGSSPRPKGDPRYYGGTIPRLMVGDLTRDGKVVTPKIDFLTEEGAAKSRPMKSGDFIVAVSGQPGQPCILAIDACIHDGFAGLRDLDTSRVDKDYLYQFMLHTKQKLSSSAVGAIFKNLTTDQLRELQIPLPPLDEQKRIAEILDKADAIRQKRKQAIDLANEFLRSVFLDMFGDPVTNPKGWEVKNIVNLVSKEKHAIKRGPFGGALKKEIFVDSGYLVYEQYHALNNNFEFARYFIDESKYQELEAFKVSAGDIIISCSGVNLGRLAIVPEGSPDGIINQALLKVKLDESKMLNDMFVAIFTHPNFKNEFFGEHRGSGVPNFPPMSTFKEFGFIVPPLDEQKQYLRVVNKVKVLKRRIEFSVSSANEQFNSLSQKAFSGQL